VSESRLPPRRDKPRSAWLRWLLVAGIVILVFVLGIAIGKALNDAPPPPSTETYVRTLTTLTDRPGETTGP